MADLVWVSADAWLELVRRVRALTLSERELLAEAMRFVEATEAAKRRRNEGNECE